ncbi:N/A [soil metagenome]
MSERVPSEPIAIVGIGCRLPGGANDPDAFWRVLRDKVDTTGDVPPDRWDVDAYHDPTGKRPGSITARRGAFVSGMDQFDPGFFGISPREATRIDPQHRMLLEVAWEAMEDAGKIPSELAGTPVGVFVGISWNDYSAIQLAPGNADSIDTHTGTGGAMSVAANRVSHAFDFRGPSVAVDTACSSALVAIHLACTALRNHECPIALAGGVNAMLIPAYFIALSRLNMLSPVGQCRAFDADGKGYVRGEGAGLVALRRLSDAQRDGDRIYALIHGSAVNQDGHTNGITVPSQASQEVVVREALLRAGVRARDISYVEAHGTGTPVGDPIEAHALGSVIGQDREEGDVCYLGSVKTNIGHLESAAGIAGLLKTTLALAHEQIPPNLHFDTPHPGIPFERFRLRVPTSLQAWPRSAKPRYAGVNSFGFGGTNAHVILGEVPFVAGRPDARAPGTDDPGVLVISARTPAALRAHVSAHAAHLETVRDPEAFDDTCRTAAVRRDHLEHRLAVVGRSAGDVQAQLQQWLVAGHAPAVRAGRTSVDTRTAFVFCGQGPQWWGMARGMLASNAVFRASIQRIDALLARDADWSLIEELARDDDSTRVNETNVLQPAIFAVQVALADVWRSWGVTPAAVVGHSMGEVAAAYVAGAMSLETATRLIFHRARVQHRTAGAGKMLAVGVSRDAGHELIAPFANRLWIAGVNGPSSITIGGEASAIAELTEALAARGVFHRAVRMEMACHTPHMDPLHDEYAAILAELELGAPQLPFYSTVTGELLTERLDADYWWGNMRQPVNFLGAAESLVALGITRFVELGPHPVLASGITEVLLQANRQGTVVPSIRRSDDDVTVMLQSLGALFTVGQRVRWQAVVGTVGTPARLPNYPWQRQRYWNESPRALGERLGAQRKALLGARQPGAHGCWESALAGARYPFLAHHVVQETIVVPGAALGVLAMMAGDAELPGAGRIVVEDLEFAKPLFVPTEGAQTMQLTARSDGAVEIHSRVEGRDEAWTRNATAHVRREPDLGPPPPRDLADLRRRCTREISVDDLYLDLAVKGINLGPSFRGVTRLVGGMHEALARIEAPAEIAGDIGAYPIHPVLLDSCLQTFLAAMPTGHAGLHLPVEIGRFRMYTREPVRAFWVHVHMKTWSDRTVNGDAILMDDDGNVIGEATSCVVRVVHDTEASRPNDDLLYQFGWQLQHGARDDGDLPLPSPHVLTADAREHFAATASAASQHYAAYYATAQPQFEQVATEYVLAAFRELGWHWQVGDRFVLRAVASRCGIVPRHHRLFARLVEMLVEDGYFARDDQSGDTAAYTALEMKPSFPRKRESNSGLGSSNMDSRLRGNDDLVNWDADSHAQLQDVHELTRRYPWAAPELSLLARCGSGLAAVLRGEQESVQLVFPGGDLSDVEHLNQDFPVLRAYNATAAEVVSQVVGSYPGDRSIRVLEVGGGTGALTSHIVDRLPADRTTYVHTDVSAMFGRQAREKFADHPFMRYEVLDIERPPSEQGFDDGSFDLVLAGNVLHATANLDDTLAHVRALLAPGGVAIILEAKRLPRWVELIFGLTDGWWRYDDVLRENALSPLLTEDRWVDVLRHNGFQSAAAITDARHLTDAGHAVIVAQVAAPIASRVRPLAPAHGRHWLILADQGGTGARIAADLRARGATTSLIERPSDAAHDDIDALIASAERATPADEILYCWSLDRTAARDMADAATMARDVSVAIDGAFRLTRALLALRTGGTLPRLTFLTAGAQSPSGESPSVAQAPLWGFGRVVMSEHYDLHARLIDADASGDVSATLVDELTAGTEDEVALRGSRRYLRRLVPRQDLHKAVVGTGRAGTDAFALRVATPGVLDSLEYHAVPRAAVRPGEVEVEVHAAGLNFKDVMLAMGMLPDHALDASHGGWTLGREFAGRVVRIGDGVTNVAVGDEVLGLGSSAFGSFCTTFAGAVVVRPPTLTPEQAAAIPLVFVTAHYGLNTLAKMKAGDRVLIHNASGGVGLAAIQLAQRAGAAIFATAGSDEKRAFVRSLGIQHVMDSRSLAFAEEIMAITNGEGVDIVLNALPGQGIEKGLSVLRSNGRFLEIGRRDIWQNSRIGLGHFTRNLTLIAIDVDRSGREQPEVVTEVFREVVEGFADGSLKPLPFTVHEPHEVASVFRLMAQSRHTGKLVFAFKERTVALAPAPVDDTPPVRADATYLLTGGLGGFGLVVADWLVTHGARHLVLVGRNGAASTEAVEAVAQLAARGAEVRVVKADVTSEAEVERLVADIARTMPPLRGIMHMAMVLDDSFITQLDLPRMHRVIAPKVQGAWNLHRATLGTTLDWFAMFSSAAAVFGNPGQSNYAAANAYFPALAHLRHAQGLPAISIDWGRLGGVGYVAQHDRVGEFLDRQGYPPVMPDEALSTLGVLLRSGEPQASVMRVDWAKWRSFFPTTHAISARFADVAATGLARTAATSSGERHHGRAVAIATSGGERREQVLTVVTDHLARVLGTAAASVDREARLNALGLDSLMAVELRNRLEREFGVDIPVMTLLQGPTVSGVAEIVDVAIGGAPVGGTSTSPAVAMPESAAPLVEGAILRDIAHATAQHAVNGPRAMLDIEDGGLAVEKSEDLESPVRSPYSSPGVVSRMRPESDASGARTETSNGNAIARASSSAAHSRPSTWFRRVGPGLTRAALTTVTRLEVEGIEHIPLTGPLVLVANHVNALDALLMFGYVPRRMSSFVKASLRDQPVVGWFVREMLDAIWVTRGAGDEAALAEAIRVVTGGGALAIKPEGTRSRTSVLREGQNGAAFIASQTGAVVIPVVAFGHERLRGSLARLTRTAVRIRVGAPLKLPAVSSARDLAANTDRIMRSMAALLPSEYRGFYQDGPRAGGGPAEAGAPDEFDPATDKQLAKR